MAKSEKPNPWRYAHMGMEFAGAALVLALVGWFIDSRYGSEPWGAVTGATVGFAGGLYLFIKDAIQANRENAAAWKRSKSQTQAPPSTTPDANAERDAEP